MNHHGLKAVQPGHTVITIILIILVKSLQDCTGKLYSKTENNIYRNDPKISDRYAWANSADPDQTAPRGAV